MFEKEFDKTLDSILTELFGKKEEEKQKEPDKKEEPEIHSYSFTATLSPNNSEELKKSLLGQDDRKEEKPAKVRETVFVPSVSKAEKTVDNPSPAPKEKSNAHTKHIVVLVEGDDIKVRGSSNLEDSKIGPYLVMAGIRTMAEEMRLDEEEKQAFESAVALSVWKETIKAGLDAITKESLE